MEDPTTDSPEQYQPLPEDWERAAAVVAHPDDLEYGAASAVARWTAQGKEVVYVLATRGEAGIDALPPEVAGERRAAEERASAAEVGVSVVEFLDHPDGMLEYSLALRRDLARALRRHRPDVLITINHHDTWGPGSGRNQADHIALGRAALDAARDAGNRWVFRELLDEGLEPWGGCRRAFVSGSPAAKHAVGVEGEPLARGVASLRAHHEYLSNLPAGTLGTDPEGFLRGFAEQSGARFGGVPAVTFEMVEL